MVLPIKIIAYPGFWPVNILKNSANMLWASSPQPNIRMLKTTAAIRMSTTNTTTFIEISIYYIIGSLVKKSDYLNVPVYIFPGHWFLTNVLTYANPHSITMDIPAATLPFTPVNLLDFNKIFDATLVTIMPE